MAIRANFDVDVADRGARFNRGAARACDNGFFIFGMYRFFHAPFYTTSTPALQRTLPKKPSTVAESGQAVVLDSTVYGSRIGK